MKGLWVKNQEELDKAVDFDGIVYIDFRGATLRRAYKYRVVARENSSVVARGNSSVDAWENSSVVARGNSSVVAWENSSVVARENSSVDARENSSVDARENSSVVARGNSSVVAWENSSVVARENSSVDARENSSVVARENSSVVARGNSSVVAWGNVQICDRTWSHKIKVHGNSRIVYMPKTIYEFLDFYGIKHTKTIATMYKAVHKRDGQYVADYNGFKYEIGKVLTAECDTDTIEMCGQGLHVAHLHWAVDFGKNWKDIAILEIKTKIADIVLPEDSDGRVRTSKLKVIREVPLEECGVLGKILARRRNGN